MPAVKDSWVRLITEETILVSETEGLVELAKTAVSPGAKPKVLTTVMVVAPKAAAPFRVVLTLGRLLDRVSLALVKALVALLVGGE